MEWRHRQECSSDGAHNSRGETRRIDLVQNAQTDSKAQPEDTSIRNERKCGQRNPSEYGARAALFLE